MLSDAGDFEGAAFQTLEADGTLQPRDNPALYGTPREEPLLAPLKTKPGTYYAELAKTLVSNRARVGAYLSTPFSIASYVRLRSPIAPSQTCL